MKCAECLVTAYLYVCGGCLNQVYCSDKCQKKGWPTHKARCLIEAKRTREQAEDEDEEEPEEVPPRERRFYFAQDPDKLAEVLRTVVGVQPNVMLDFVRDIRPSDIINWSRVYKPFYNEIWDNPLFWWALAIEFGIIEEEYNPKRDDYRDTVLNHDLYTVDYEYENFSPVWDEDNLLGGRMGRQNWHLDITLAMLFQYGSLEAIGRLLEPSALYYEDGPEIDVLAYTFKTHLRDQWHENYDDETYDSYFAFDPEHLEEERHLIIESTMLLQRASIWLTVPAGFKAPTFYSVDDVNRPGRTLWPRLYDLKNNEFFRDPDEEYVMEVTVSDASYRTLSFKNEMEYADFDDSLIRDMFADIDQYSMSDAPSYGVNIVVRKK